MGKLLLFQHCQPHPGVMPADPKAGDAQRDLSDFAPPAAEIGGPFRRKT
jgi:hypothetical protein